MPSERAFLSYLYVSSDCKSYSVADALAISVAN